METFIKWHHADTAFLMESHEKMEGSVSEESFASILFLDGKGTISDDKEQLAFQKGDSFFLTAGGHSGN